MPIDYSYFWGLIFQVPFVPGKALPGEKARRRAVEGIAKAGVPVAT